MFPPSPTGLVNLRALFPAATFVGCTELAVEQVTANSRDVTPGCLFAALPGTAAHGTEYISEALQSGAAAILSDRSLAGRSVPHCIVPDARQAYGVLCHALHFHPAQRLGVVGVTGTNGKTTTTWLVRSLLEQLAQSCGLLGTVEYSNGINSCPSQLTTPDARHLAGWLGSMVASGTRYAALELSSHALQQQRTAGLSLDVAIITNLTHDHLDYHGDMIAYRAAKSRIVRHLKPGGLLVINADDSGAQSCLPALAAEPQQIMTFGIQADADLQAEILEETLLGTRLQLRHGLESSRAFVPLAGRHNVENVLAAVAAVRHFGFGLAEIAEVLPRCASAPGRLQTVPTQGQFLLFVDYAHTPDAIARVVHTVRELTFGKVIVVCGAGGDRDKSKRPEMGRAAATADVVIFTADNPRSEDPARIIAEMQTGVPAHSCETMIELDRRQAIELAIGRAEPGDVVLILGKGHEREQVIGTTRLPFDDVVEAQQVLKQVRQSSLK